MSENNSSTQKSTIHDIGDAISATLASGMYVTIAAYLFGVILSFVKLKQVPSLSHQYFSSLSGFLSGLVHLDPRSFLFLGTLTLISTPPFCVLVSVFAFWKRRDYRYVGVTAVVLLVIAASILVGSIFKIKLG